MSEPTYAFTLPAPAPPAAHAAPTPETPRRGRFNGALWLVGIGLLANAAVMLVHGQAPDIVLDRSAFGQAVPAGNGAMLGARGIYMMPAQLGPNSYGMYLMDVDAGTVCVYRVNSDNTRFSLMAARSYKNDRYLENFNNDKPFPKDVQGWVDTQRTRVGIKEKDDQPTVDQNPKPDANKPDLVPGITPNEAPGPSPSPLPAGDPVPDMPK